MKLSRHEIIKNKRVRNEVMSLCASTPFKAYCFLKCLLMRYEQFSNAVPKRGLVIDNGCGYGLVTLFLSVESKDREMIGIDPTVKRINRIKDLFLRVPANVKFLAKDIRTLEVERADCIIMEQVLHHIPRSEQREVLETVYHKLRKEGTFIIRENNKRWSFRFMVFNHLSEYLLSFDLEKANFLTEKELFSMLEETGFKCRSIRSPWYFIFDTSFFVCSK